MTMTTHKTGTREQWLAARLKLLDAEKALTKRQSDELAQRRQELPWVRVDKDYRFDTDEGEVSLADLFKGRRSFCSITSCSGRNTRPAACPVRRSPMFRRIAVHLANHEVSLGRRPARLSKNTGLKAADGLDLSLGVFAGQ